MENLFLGAGEREAFSWENLGDVREGRCDLGEEVPVAVYRLMQRSVFEALAGAFGKERANYYLRKAGYLAGGVFAKSMLELEAEHGAFLAELQSKLREYKLGILRMERYDAETGEVMLTVAQDADCSGLPVTGGTVCHYGEGFFAGILEAYTGRPYTVREIDCWAAGDRVCRFLGKAAVARRAGK